MQNTKDTSSHLILAFALIVIIAIGIWVIVSLQFSKKPGKSNLEKEEKEYYYEAGEKKPSPSDKISLEEGDEAPDFRLESIEGRFISLGSLRGRSFLLVFFNTGCGFCKKEMKDLVELAKVGKEIIAIAIWGGEKDDLIRFAEKLEIDFPILIDENDEIAREYFIKGTPTNFLIDKNGKIAEKHRGYAPRIELERIFKSVD